MSRQPEESSVEVQESEWIVGLAELHQQPEEIPGQ